MDPGKSSTEQKGEKSRDCHIGVSVIRPATTQVDPKERCREDECREQNSCNKTRLVRPASGKGNRTVPATPSAGIAWDRKTKNPRLGQRALSAVSLKWTVPRDKVLSTPE